MQEQHELCIYLISLSVILTETAKTSSHDNQYVAFDFPQTPYSSSLHRKTTSDPLPIRRLPSSYEISANSPGLSPWPLRFKAQPSHFQRRKVSHQRLKSLDIEGQKFTIRLSSVTLPASSDQAESIAHSSTTAYDGSTRQLHDSDHRDIAVRGSSNPRLRDIRDPEQSESVFAEGERSGGWSKWDGRIDSSPAQSQLNNSGPYMNIQQYRPKQKVVVLTPPSSPIFRPKPTDSVPSIFLFENGATRADLDEAELDEAFLESVGIVLPESTSSTAPSQNQRIGPTEELTPPPSPQKERDIFDWVPANTIPTLLPSAFRRRNRSNHSEAVIYTPPSSPPSATNPIVSLATWLPHSRALQSLLDLPKRALTRPPPPPAFPNTTTATSSNSKPQTPPYPPSTTDKESTSFTLETRPPAIRSKSHLSRRTASSRIRDEDEAKSWF